MSTVRHPSALDRREFLRGVALGAVALALPRQARAEPAPKPNIVYMICDDLGYGDVRCLNPQRGKIPTPQIDRLASQGIVFTDAHSGSAVCSPTRYGVLTGRYCWRTRLQSGVLDGNVPPLIARDRLTVPELLRQQGYSTTAIGKWHLGYTFDPAEGRRGRQAGGAGMPVGTRILEGPTTRGFDSFYGFSHARAIRTLVENDRVAEGIDAVEMLPRLTRRAVEAIGQRADEAKKGKPFFLYLAFNSPHTPIVPSAPWRGRSGLNAYADFVMQTDAAVGEVLAALDRHGLADQTLVIFTSDNGCSPAANVGQLERQGHYPSAQFRGYKADIWDGGHRVPFVARWPGKVRAGATSDQLICLTDLMATCAELLGIKLPENAAEDSVSILPALLGTDKGPLREAVVHHSISGRFAIRQGKWKLELCPGSGGWGSPTDAAALNQGLPPIQLYDMTEDIGERRNQRAEQPEVVQRLTALLEKYAAQGRSTPGAPQRNDVPVSIRKRERQEQGAKSRETQEAE